jgi:cytochrome c oxidase accessory protein FixG
VNSTDTKTIPIAAVPNAPTADAEDEVGLYEIRKKIYPRSVTGTFATWRVALVIATQVVFYGLPWLYWNDRQAVLFDLAARKFYIFGLVFWPQDVIYLTVLLILSALSLFLFTAVAGRLWCGYACPQTVYTEIFLWIERKIEGERQARMRLDAMPNSLEKLVKKALKHTAWIALSIWTGYTFVGYFTPIRDLGVRAILWDLGGWEAFWIVFYSLATYGNAGWMREQVCKYMCPYARFQSVMFDKDTLVIAYDRERGDPRGSRSKKIDAKAAGLGDCIDCSICVQVCPTGIDIRQGLQYECIGCAACIDGCDQVMDKMGYPRGLIRYASENALLQHAPASTMLRRIFRPRTLLYTALLLAVATAAGVSLYLRNPLKMDVIRDRGALAREAAPGVIENVYRIQIMNTDEKARTFRLSVEGLPGLTIADFPKTLDVEAAATRLLPLRLQVPADAAAPGPHRIEVVIEAVDDARISRREKSTFILPNP